MLESNKPVAIKWHRNTFGDVSVTFDDGHTACFEAYVGGGGVHIEGLRKFSLCKGEGRKLLFIYNGRLSRYEDERDNKVALMADDYTQQSVAVYWRAAREYIVNEKDAEVENADLAWRLVCYQGDSVLCRLEKGEAEVLKKVVA